MITLPFSWGQLGEAFAGVMLYNLVLKPATVAAWRRWRKRRGSRGRF
jgi:hypothetical protein